MQWIVGVLIPLLKGTLVTLELCAISGVVGTALGMLIGLACVSRFAPLRWAATAYSNVLRGVPVLIILLFTYFALPLLMPAATFSQLESGSIGLSIFVSAYVAEVLRGSLASVARGQFEASDALGLSRYQRMRYVILPQALRVFVPPWIGTILGMVKDSSLVSVIGLVDLTLAAKLIGASTMNQIGMFVGAAAIYFVICFPISAFGRWTEQRLSEEVDEDGHGTAFENELAVQHVGEH